jgi:hypothetical protein
MGWEVGSAQIQDVCAGGWGARDRRHDRARRRALVPLHREPSLEDLRRFLGTEPQQALVADAVIAVLGVLRDRSVSIKGPPPKDGPSR